MCSVASFAVFALNAQDVVSGDSRLSSGGRGFDRMRGVTINRLLNTLTRRLRRRPLPEGEG